MARGEALLPIRRFYTLAIFVSSLQQGGESAESKSIHALPRIECTAAALNLVF